MKAPEIIRVKRKREEDSVQALLIQEDKPSKRGKFVFKLAKTVESGLSTQIQELNTPLLKLSDDGEARHFILEQRKRKREGQELPAEISEMLNDYLSLGSNSAVPQRPRKLKRPGGRRSEPEQDTKALPSLDYVYDIYYREVVPEDEFVFDESTVGYIKIVEDSGDLIPEEEDDENSVALSDDEDSNEEAYYRNDYPEDEDDDRSVLFGSDDGVAPAATRKYAESDASEETGVESAPSHVAMLGDEETDLLYQKFAGAPNVLQAADTYFDSADERSGVSDEEFEEDHDIVDFTQHSFFPTDAEDPLAIHRDRIFARLERMIEKRS
ncbi:LAQU0S04e07998g1_1 [Lachancea quebecensis]|uniref:LAQU0S04e07998g1_1 n=1 Tax=Lachancea quebecensis TaxID=1654605 RepID=A0A0P1KT08_9SACH|nr:LAQU0S04e07998g1_1 [Lachancea quebecensis]